MSYFTKSSCTFKRNCWIVLIQSCKTTECEKVYAHVYNAHVPSTATTLYAGWFNSLGASIYATPQNGCCPSTCSLRLYLAPSKKTAEAYFIQAYRGRQLCLIISKGGKIEEDRQQGERNRMRWSVVNDVAQCFMREKHCWRADGGKQPGASQETDTDRGTTMNQSNSVQCIIKKNNSKH